MVKEYAVILIFFLVSTVLALVILFANNLVTRTGAGDGSIEKLSAYECGFNPFNEARYKFDVSFYLVSILFIIFDIEIALLFPWSVTIGKLSLSFSGFSALEAFFTMLAFLLILTIGFVYEWQQKALEW